MFIHGLDALDDIRAKEVAMLTSHIPASSTESSYRTRGPSFGICLPQRYSMSSRTIFFPSFFMSKLTN